MLLAAADLDISSSLTFTVSKDTAILLIDTSIASYMLLDALLIKPSNSELSVVIDATTWLFMLRVFVSIKLFNPDVNRSTAAKILVANPWDPLLAIVSNSLYKALVDSDTMLVRITAFCPITLDIWSDKFFTASSVAVLVLDVLSATNRFNSVAKVPKAEMVSLFKLPE